MVMNFGRISVTLIVKRLPSQEPLRPVLKRIWRENRKAVPGSSVLLESSKTIMAQWLGLKVLASIAKAYA